MTAEKGLAKPVDAFKSMVEVDAKMTLHNLKRFDLAAEPSLAQEVYVLRGAKEYSAYTSKALGPKNMVADMMFEHNEKTYYDSIAQDLAALTINNLITVGAQPTFLNLALIASDPKWVNCTKRAQELSRGLKQACLLAQCASGGATIKSNKNMVYPGMAIMVGSAGGIIADRRNLITGNITDGDSIVIIRSSGVHSSGFNLIDEIATKLPASYATRIGDSLVSPTFGEVLLTPSLIYSPLIKECQKKHIEIHYAIDLDNWTDLMRHPGKFSYVIEEAPIPQPIFNFIQKQGVIDDKTAYANFNMNAGLALYLPKEQAKTVVELVYQLGFKGDIAGYIESGPKKELVIRPKNLVYTA